MTFDRVGNNKVLVFNTIVVVVVYCKKKFGKIFQINKCFSYKVIEKRHFSFLYLIKPCKTHFRLIKRSFNQTIPKY